MKSAPIKVRCPWFLDTASWYRQNGPFDLGIHLTLWEDRGQPVFDHCRVLTRRGDAEDHLGFVGDVFDRLPAGLYCVLVHPAIDPLEIRSITGDWRDRVADVEVFRQPSFAGPYP